MFVKKFIMTMFSIIALYLFILAVLFSLKYDVNIFTMSFIVVILLFVAYALFPFKSGGAGASHAHIIGPGNISVEKTNKKAAKRPSRKRK